MSKKNTMKLFAKPFKISTLIILSFFAINSCKNDQSVTPELKKDQIVVYETAKNTDLRLTKSDSLNFQTIPQSGADATITVDPSVTHQEILGIGGALTDAVAETFAKMPSSSQQELLTAFFDPQRGNGYTLARTNINSCDFSSDSYTYVSQDDSLLNTFSVAHDEKYRIPFIKKAIAAAGGNLTMYVSPWSPPAWMKSNNSMLQGGNLLPRYRQSWANYFAKFIRAYESEGIPIWGLTVQNEPMASTKWESCIYTNDEERDFIKGYLGPTLQKEGLSDRKIIAWDHNRDMIYERASAIMSDPDAAKYVWGFGFHWYETWRGEGMMFGNVQKVYNAYPTKNLIFTEGSIENFQPDSLNNWAMGERYGYSMINDFNSGASAWTDWNIFLDQNGGPNHVGNYCFAAIHANTQTGQLTYTNIYYYLGHFSKFIRPQAKRIDISSDNNQLITTAFLNSDGKIAVVVMNGSDKQIKYNLKVAARTAGVTSLPHSITTLLFLK